MAIAQTSLPSRTDVVIVGAGLAGLATAAHLQSAGVDICVLEADDDVGGRIRSDHVDGFTFDRGFQLYNPAYPEGMRMLDHPDLRLQPFLAGALVSLGDRRIRIADPRRTPRWAFDTLTAPLGSLLSEARFAAYALTRSVKPARALRDQPDMAIRAALTEAGVDDLMIDRFLRPFLAGVFLEPDLATSRRFADFVLRSFIRGTPSVPAAGMGALPRQLASRLTTPVHLGTRVTRTDATGVLTERGRIDARAVVIATDPKAAQGLIPGLAIPDARSVTTWYFRPDVPGSDLTEGHGVLVIDAQRRGPLVNAVVLTNAASSYAPPGEALVSCSALGGQVTADGESAARRHLGGLLGVDTTRWELLATYPIPYALPAMNPPLSLQRHVRLGPGRYVAGDHRDTASIQGALVSGRRAATAVLADFGLPTPPATTT